MITTIMEYMIKNAQGKRATDLQYQNGMRLRAAQQFAFQVEHLHTFGTEGTLKGNFGNASLLIALS